MAYKWGLLTILTILTNWGDPPSAPSHNHPKRTLQRVSGRSVSQTSFVDVGYDADKNQLVRHVTDVGNPNSQWWGVTAMKKKCPRQQTHGIHVWYIYLHLVYQTWMGWATKPCFFVPRKNDDVFFFRSWMVTWKHFVGPPYKSLLRHAAMK